jgi:di/tricarboxylate transporter
MDIWIVTLILFSALILLATEKISVDRTAIGIMVALMLSGILTPPEAIAGFSNPAVITVAALFIVSEGMIRSGVVGSVAQKVIELSRGNRKAALAISLLFVGVASAFINNTPVVVLFIPIIFSLSCEYDFSPSKILIPMSYISILAGTCTLIGTSTNIIISDLSAAQGYGFITMFELTALGLPNALLGCFLIVIASRYLMPAHAAPVCEVQDRENQRYLTEVVVAAESPLVGQPSASALQDSYPSLQVIEIVRDSKIVDPNRPRESFQTDDLLLLKGSASDLITILQKKCVALPYVENGVAFDPEEDELIVELVVPPQSTMLRQRLLSTHLQGDPQVQIIAIKRQGVHYSEQKIRDVRLREGDIILVRCPREKLKRIRRESDLIIVEDIHHQIVFKARSRRAIVIFSGIIIAASTGVADIMVCAVTGVLLMALFRCIHLRHAYRALQPEVLLLIVGTIALGTAMEKTGASRLYAESMLGLFKGLGPRMILCGILILTSLSTNLLSNNATAVLMIPVAISTAQALGVSPRPFIIAVCFGASACFATPIGYKTNLMVYGPGHYRFSDYLKLGIPLNIVIIVMGSIFIPYIWPL